MKLFDKDIYLSRRGRIGADPYKQIPDAHIRVFR